MNRNILSYITVVCCILLAGCHKTFLEEKPLRNLQVPQSIADFQAIMDVDFGPADYSAHTLANNGADEYVITEKKWAALGNESQYLRQIYVWSQKIDMLPYESIEDWNRSYMYIFYANQALYGLASLKPQPQEQDAWNNVKGSALFFRAYRYYHLAQQYAFPYVKAADNPNGLPLRLEPDVTLSVSRSSVHATYKRILDDALASIDLLPAETKRTNHIRPGKAAALALVAKLYLLMEEYEKAAEYANQCLQLRPQLIDFNTLDAGNPANRYDYAFTADYGATNPEILYYSIGDNGWSTSLFASFGDWSAFNPALLNLYPSGDLRSQVYFRPYFDMDNLRYLVFKGSYATYSIFTGMATDEIYLLRAECNARLNKADKALDDLNLLLKSRIAAPVFTPVTESDPEKLLRIIFRERRKELVFRGLRWEDLRRLNKEPRFAETLVREIGGQRYELPPNDPRYTWPIPVSEIDAAFLPQNPR